jgi:hypothetical protein
MRKAVQFIDALNQTKRANIIHLLETAVEMERLQYRATHDDETRDRISDGCVLLAFLRFGGLRNLDIPPI